MGGGLSPKRKNVWLQNRPQAISNQTPCHIDHSLVHDLNKYDTRFKHNGETIKRNNMHELHVMETM